MITTVLFDLDGTLLPMDNEEFIRVYFGLLCKRFAALGYDPQELSKAVWTGTTMMIKNNGVLTNEEVFWNKFQEIVGERALKDRDVFDDFYVTDFNKAKSVCGYDEELVRLVADLKSAGYRIALATNPVFPAIATESRIRWAGLEPSDFELYTTYENIGFCKPNPEYYREILRRLDVPAEECIMIGNDAIEDTAAQEVGINVYLLTDNLLNKENRDISAYPHGGSDGIRKLLLK
ncbi:MAG: HAD family hydrolase [Acutalibacteraceae bacterium]